MKLTHKLCGAALLGAIGIGMALPGTTKALDENKLPTNAEIEFTRDTGTPGTKTQVTKPSETGSTITNITTDITDPGEFGIVTATPIDFKKHEVLATSREYFAAPFHANPGSTDPNYPDYLVENFVKFRDDRSTLDHTYKLQARVSKNFTTIVDGTTEKDLAGSELTLSNLKLTSIVDPALRPTDAPAATVTLKGDGSNTEVLLNNTKTDKGRGDYEITFGNQDAGTADQSVKLTVPNSTEIFYGKYNARIEWTLTNAK